MKNVPFIIPVFNQLTYLKNTINWIQWYYPRNPIVIVDNNSTYEPLKTFYEQNVDSRISIMRCGENDCKANLAFTVNAVKKNVEFYVITDPDIMPHPSTPGNFLEILRSFIDQGYHRAGFNLITDHMHPRLNDIANITHNENSFRENQVAEVKGWKGYKAPIDTTLCLYSSNNSGWHSPMDGKDWGNCIRIMEAFHMPWHQDPDYINPEMDHYYNTCLRAAAGEPSAGKNNNKPKKYSFPKDDNGTILLSFFDVFDPLESIDAIENNEFTGFREDYLVIHSLIRRYAKEFRQFMEVGTNHGKGTMIIKNALGKYTHLYSLDLPNDRSDAKENTGRLCTLPFTQIFSDSLTYNFKRHGVIEGWFIDGAHDYEHVNKETKEAMATDAKLIIYHDADIQEVYNGIVDALNGNEEYELYRVTDTRIAYARKK